MAYRITSCLLLALAFSFPGGCEERSESGRLREVWRLHAGRGYAQSVVFSPDGKRIAVASIRAPIGAWEGELRPYAFLYIVDVDQGAVVAKLESDHTIQSVDIVDQNTRVLGLFGKQIELLDASTLAVTQTLDKEWYEYCQVLSGEKLVLARSDRRLRLVSMETGKRVYSRRLKRKWPDAPEAWTATSGGRFVAEAMDQQVYVFDFATAQERVWPMSMLMLQINALALTPDGQTLAEVGLGKSIIRDVPTGQVRHTLNVSGTDGDISPDGRLLAISGEELTLWDMSSGTKLDATSSNASCAAFSPDGSHLVTASQGSQSYLILWKVGDPGPGPASLLWGLIPAAVLIVAIAVLLKRRRAKRVAPPPMP